MRPSLPPDMGDNAAAQATLEARLRREQIKRVSQVEDLSNVVGNATDGQALLYSQAKGAWVPGAAGIQGDRATFVPATSGELVASGSFWNQALTDLGDMTQSSIGLDGTTTHITINAAGIYLINAQVVWAANATGRRGIKVYDVGSGEKDGSVPSWENDVPATATGNQAVSVSALMFMTVTAGIPDTIGVAIYQNSGGNLAVQGNTLIRVLRLT